MPKFYATKTYGNERGLSCTFRQWRTESHCRFLHGYSIGVRLVFGAETLDENNWVYDFGGLKWVKEFLEMNFDHTTCVAADDPELQTFRQLADSKLIQLNILPGIGCEKFAEHIALFIQPELEKQTQCRVFLKTVEVFEHGANAAIYECIS